MQKCFFSKEIQKVTSAGLKQFRPFTLRLKEQKKVAVKMLRTFGEFFFAGSFKLLKAAFPYLFANQIYVLSRWERKSFY